MATIADVARRAGVAPSTVSYVLSNRRSISAGTRRAVEQAIADLDYRPHAGARSLRGAGTRVLALSLPPTPGRSTTTDRYEPSGARFIHHISVAARTHDHDVLLLTGGEGEAGLRRVAGSRLADGAVLMSVRTRDPRIPVLRTLGFPASLIGKPADPQGLSWCDFDFEGGTALAVEELVRAGHRRLAMLTATKAEFRAGINYAPRTLAGAQEAAQVAGVGLQITRTSDSPRTLRQQVEAVLSGEPSPSALLIHGTPQAHLMLGLVRELGYALGRDLSVVIVGSGEELPSEVALTRVDLPVQEMSETAVEAAIAVIEGRQPPGHRLIPACLVRGDSVAAPPSR